MHLVCRHDKTSWGFFSGINDLQQAISSPPRHHVKRIFCPALITPIVPDFGAMMRAWLHKPHIQQKRHNYFTVADERDYPIEK